MHPWQHNPGLRFQDHELDIEGMTWDLVGEVHSGVSCDCRYRLSSDCRYWLVVVSLLDFGIPWHTLKWYPIEKDTVVGLRFAQGFD